MEVVRWRGFILYVHTHTHIYIYIYIYTHKVAGRVIERGVVTGFECRGCCSPSYIIYEWSVTVDEVREGEVKNFSSSSF